MIKVWLCKDTVNLGKTGKKTGENYKNAPEKV
jgi:hypothetical protein